MTSEEILFDAEERMEKALTVFRDELRGLRTGRATPALVDSIRVEYYGSPTPLKQLAQIRGHLKENLFVTKFRKIFARDEMNDDLLIVPAKYDDAEDSSEYEEILPTSPP